MITMKIDRRHVYGIIIDTETANGLNDPFFYDCGWQVIDSHGRKYVERSFVNRDIFNYEQSLMRSAYYSDKIPQYCKDIKQGRRIMASTYEIRKALADDVKKFSCVFICAHNAHFDYKALQGTQRWITKSKYRFFVPYGLEWWDTMKMARSVICKMPTYRKFCEKYGYFTLNGQMRVTAEILFRFISKNNEFVESHTGLEDVDIERQIFVYCKRQHKPMVKKLFKD